MKTTKIKRKGAKNRNDAERVAQALEDAAEMARKGELTKARGLKIHEALMEMIGEPTDNQSVAEYLRGWLASRETTGRANSTVKRYQPIIKGFIAHLPEVRRSATVGSVTAGDIERFRDAEVASGKGASTANFAIKVLRAAFGAAQRKGLALSNPAEAAEPIATYAEPREPFTDDEIRALLAASKEEDWHGAILFGAWTGARLSDVVALTWQKLDLERGTATFVQGKSKKDDDPRKRTVTVFLHPEVKTWLATRTTAIGAAPLFPSLHGRKPGSHGGLSNAFSALMSKAKVAQVLGAEKKGKGRQFRGKGFHSFRHTFNSRLANADVPAEVRKAMSGHSSDESHERYIHLDLATQERAVSKLSPLASEQ